MNVPILTPPPNQYEPYPGCPLSDFANDFLNNNPIILQAFCMKERIDPCELSMLVQDVLIDWELTEPRHRDRQDALRHLLNHLRIKIRNEQRNNRTTQRPQSSGRGQNRNPTAYDIACDLFGGASD